MQLRNTVVLLTALSALGLMMTACDSSETGSSTCTADADCTGTEICHPTAKICVQTCTAGADCPSTAKTCAAISASDTRMVCQCSTDALCNTDGSTDLVCSNLDKVCEAKCTTDAACGTGRTCDTATGQCKAGSTGTCSPACGTGQTCDPTTNTCVSSGAACTGTSQSTCAYGQFCGSTSKCADAPVAPTTCSNFATNRPDWSASTSSGPVIYSVTKLSYQTNSAYCTSGDAYIVSVKAYRTDADWPSTRAGLSGFFYVTTNTTRHNVIDEGLLVPNTGYNRNTSNFRDAEFQTYLCPGSNVSSIQVGYFFTGGNPVCQTLTQ